MGSRPLPDASGAPAPPWWKNAYVPGALLIALILLAYIPVWHSGFIWDDDDHLTANPCIVGPLGFKEIWTTARSTYYPLVLTTFWIAHALWGLNPLPYHLLNVAVHGACAILLWRILGRLRIAGAWLGAALWALHPVMVESVAWITELKNTQSCLFYLLTIFFFAKWLEAKPIRTAAGNLASYFPVVIFGVLAFLSKTSTVMLPVILGLCWWWLEGRWRWRNAAWLLPLLALAVAGGAWTIWEQKYHSGALGADFTQTWPERIAVAGDSFWFYLGKLAWPSPLIFIYPRWKIALSNPLAYLPALAAAGALVFLWLKRNGPFRPLFFAAAYFSISLFPVLDFFNVYFFRYSFVGDHFQYLASMGPLALAGAGLASIPVRSIHFTPRLRAQLCGVIVLLLGLLTWRQCAPYRDIDTLWRDTLALNPGCWMAHNNLALDLEHAGQNDDAVAHFRTAISLNPDYTEALYNLGCYYLHGGLTGEAVDLLQRASDSAPFYAEGQCALGVTLARQGRVDGAIDHLKRAIAIQPDYAEAHYNLGVLLIQKRMFRDVVAQYRRALAAKPDYLAAETGLAYLLSTCADPSVRDGPAAVPLAEDVNRRTGGSSAVALGTLAAAYAETGDFSRAIDSIRRAIVIAKAQNDLHLATIFQGHLQLYQSRRPLRDYQ